MSFEAEKIYLSRNGQIEGPFSVQDLDRMKANGEFALFSWLWKGDGNQWVAINPPLPPAPGGVTISPASSVLDELSSAADSVEDELDLSTGSVEAEVGSSTRVTASELSSPTRLNEAGPAKAVPERTITGSQKSVIRPVDLSKRVVPPVGATQQTGRLFQIICHDNLNIVTGVMERYSRTSGVMEAKGSTGPLTPFGKGCRVWINFLDQERGRVDNVEAHVAAVSHSGDHWVFEIAWDHPPSVILD
jgi:hypothetical protein